ncbi:MAG: ATP-binding cassette domain-containing protein [Pseudomonadota bacterium]
MSLLEAAGLVAGYAEPVAGPLDLTLEPGEVVGIAGPNGAGKSTLLRALAGEPLVHAGGLRRAGGELALLPQRPPRPAEIPLTAREYLGLVGAEALPTMGPWLDRRVDALSGGQFQLLAAQARLGAGAAVVLLDEPTNNLDPAAVEGVAEAIDRAAASGRGVVVVSHEGAFLARTCHRVREVEPWT